LAGSGAGPRRIFPAGGAGLLTHERSAHANARITLPLQTCAARAIAA
jgi:hypothetical protein